MNFHEFQLFRSQVLQRDPTIIDLAETNLWRSLSHLIAPIPPQPEKHIHRCHLAAAWLDLFELPSAWSKLAMISSGVRHSLSLLFPDLAKRGGELVMPSDVYPVYSQISASCGLQPVTFSTVPDLSIPERGNWILLPNPLKPAGRWLTNEDLDSVKDWLAQNRERRVLIDAVYNFQTRLHPTTLELIATEQAIVMHSLSKSWLHPQLMGVCIVPEADWPTLAPIFRCNSPEQGNLQSADYLLRQQRDLPNQVDRAIAVKRGGLVGRLPTDLARVYADVGNEAGYFTPLNASFQESLQTHRILTIPLSVFGSTMTEISVASLL